MSSNCYGCSSVFHDSLQKYSHFDLTPDVARGISEQLGGGRFSDVFRSKIHLVWRARLRRDPYLEQLLSEMRDAGVTSRSHGSEMDTDCLMVAVKRHRLWGGPTPKVEKVSWCIESFFRPN